MTDSPRDPVGAARDEFEDGEIPRSDMPTPGEQPGDRIDRYKLLQEIGEGGMGTVWMAEQKEPVKRQVALKIIKLGMDTKEVIVRFEAERQALALMDHPNIARVLDGGATDAGRPFFVMELVRGIPITQFCDEAKLGIRDRLELFTKVCDAVQHAHHKGVIHRDLKPSNVMVTLHDGVPMPKVIDFGIAKATSAELTQKTMFTEYGSMIGTPEYMAPEQAEMSALDIDTRADIYSLGVLLYELLTGTKPFNVTEVLERGYQELLRTIREDSPAKPSTRISTLGENAAVVAGRRHVNTSSLSARLRGDVDWMVMKALEKDRARRYGTATEFSADVHRYLAGEPVLAAPPSRSYRLRKFLVRRRKAVAAMAAIAVLFVSGAIGTGIGWWDAYQANQALASSNSRLEKANQDKDEALANEQSARRKAQDAEAEVREQIQRFVAIVTFNEERMAKMDARALGLDLRDSLIAAVGEGQAAALREALADVNFTDIGTQTIERNLIDPMIAAIRTRFRDEPSAQARLLNGVAVALSSLRRHARSLEIGKEALSIVADLGPRGGLGMTIRASIAVQYGALGQWEQSAKYAQEVLAAAQEWAPDRHCLAQAHYAMGLAEFGLQRPDAAIEHYRKALAIDLELGDALSASAEFSRIGLFAALTQKGAIDEAEALARDALELHRTHRDEDHPLVLRYRLAIASIRSQRGTYRGSNADLETLLNQTRTAYGATSQEAVDATLILSIVCRSRAQYPKAKQVLVDALAANESERNDRQREQSRTRLETVLRSLEAAQGDRKAADVASAKDLDAARKNGQKGLRMAGPLVMRARVLMGRGDLAEAEPLLAEALEHCQTLESSHPVRVTIQFELAVLWRRQGHLDKAIPVLRESVAGFRDAVGESHPRTISAMNSLAVALQGNGQSEEAVQILRRVVDAHRETSGAQHPTTLFFQVNYGAAVLTAGNAKLALEILLQAKAELTETVGAGHTHAIACNVHEAAALLQLEQFEEARSLLAQTVPALEQSSRVGSSLFRYALALAGQAHLACGDEEAGDRLLERALELTRTSAPAAVPSTLYSMADGLTRSRLYAAAETRWAALIQLREREWDGDHRYHNAQARLAIARGLQGTTADQATELSKHLEGLWRAPEPESGPGTTKLKRELLNLAERFYEAWHDRDPGAGARDRLAKLKSRLSALSER